MATLSPSLESEKGHGQGLGWAMGFPWDPSEWSPELAWPLSVRVFDQMRRQDSQVASVLRAVTLPIRRTQWRLDPNGARDEVVAHVSTDIGLPLLGDDSPEPSGVRVRGRFSWDEHIRMALLALPYGHMFFEQVYEIRDDGRAHLAKLAPRLPQTIGKIDVDRAGDLLAIEQYPTGQPGDTGPYIRITADRLVAYCTDREGGVWQGQSILRPVYANWLIKGKLLRVHAMTMERNGMGVPLFKAPEGATQAQVTQGLKAAQAFRAGENAGGSVPFGGDIELKGVSGTLPDVLAGIRYHDEQIAGNVLAQFLELGKTAHGSRALGASFIDFFIMALQAVADEIALTATGDVVEDLVDLNWGPDEIAPRIAVAEIAEAPDLTAQAVDQLVACGAVTNDEALEDYIRSNFRLPARTGPARPGYGTQEPPGASGDTNPAPPPDPTAASRRRERISIGGHPKVEAGSTPASAKTWSGWKLSRRLVRQARADLSRAFAGALDTRAAVKAYKDLGVVHAAAESHDIELARAALAAQSLDLAPAADALAESYGAAYVVGAHAGRTTIGGLPAPDWDSAIDWSHWTPGDLRSAAELLGTDGGRGLQALLANAGVTISSIADNRLDDLARALADGVANGDSTSTVAASLADLLSDPDRAEMIARTEVARAMTTASLDTYAENGIGQKEFLTSDPCPECQENEDAGAIATDDDFPNGDPPVHPNCQCALLPVVDTGDQTGEEE
jgi:SPP1 gp7 family putative phage head morphogenesis protein